MVKLNHLLAHSVNVYILHMYVVEGSTLKLRLKLRKPTHLPQTTPATERTLLSVERMILIAFKRY